MSILNLSLVILTGLFLSTLFGTKLPELITKYSKVSVYITDENALFVFGLSFAASIAIYAFLNIIFLKVSYLQEHHIGKKVFNNRLISKLSLYENITHGEILKNIVQEPSRVTHGYLVPLFSIFSKSLQIFITVIFLMLQNFTITIASAGFVIIIYFLIKKITAGKMIKEGEKSVLYNKQRFDTASDAILFKKEILTYSIHSKFYQQYISGNLSYINALFACDAIAMLPRYFLEFLMVIGILLLSFSQVGSQFLSDENTAFLFVAAGLRLIPLMHGVYHSMSVLSFNTESLKVILKELKVSEQVKNENFLKPFKSKSYFNSTKGIIIIKGPNGAGKTTLLDYLVGLIKTEKNLLPNLETLERLVKVKPTYVTQTPVVFEGSVRENIIMGRTVYDEGKLLELVEMFNLPLNKDVSTLSVGNKQILSIIRSLYWSEGVVVMDEPTSGLDEKNKRVLISMLEKDKTNTFIIVSHDIDLISIDADIVELQKYE